MAQQSQYDDKGVTNINNLEAGDTILIHGNGADIHTTVREFCRLEHKNQHVAHCEEDGRTIFLSTHGVESSLSSEHIKMNAHGVVRVHKK